jgi:transcriptional regulator
VNNIDNPLIHVLGKDNLPPKACCLLKIDHSESNMLGKRAREMIEKMKQKKFEGKNLKGMVNMLSSKDKSSKNIFKNLFKKEEEEKKIAPNKNESNLLNQDDENTIDKIEEEVKQLSFDNNIFDDEAEELEGGSSSDYSSDFEGGGDDITELDLLLANQDNEEESESNEAEEYEFQLAAYTSQLFMRDLINVLKFDISEVFERCPKLVKRNFRLFDESLQRRVHLYEHIIHLAHGFCRPGFIKFVTHNF